MPNIFGVDSLFFLAYRREMLDFVRLGVLVHVIYFCYLGMKAKVAIWIFGVSITWNALWNILCIVNWMNFFMSPGLDGYFIFNTKVWNEKVIRLLRHHKLIFFTYNELSIWRKFAELPSLFKTLWEFHPITKITLWVRLYIINGACEAIVLHFRHFILL